MVWNDDALGEAVATDSGSDAPTAIAATGDVKWRSDASIQGGWGRMNARTVGAPGSGATELGSAGAEALFLYLWNTFPDAIAPVVGGRGVSAAEDFSAGRQIVIPSLQGLAAAGLDDMGSAPAGPQTSGVSIANPGGAMPPSTMPPTRRDIADAGLIDFATASDIVFTVMRRHPVQHQAWCRPTSDGADGSCAPARC